MNAQNVLLGGFGPTGSASLIVTSGFSVGAVIPAGDMSSVQNVLLGGFGSTGSVSLIVTSGFSADATISVVSEWITRSRRRTRR